MRTWWLSFLIFLALALASAHAQEPSAALRGKSADAAAIAARALLGPVRIIVQHQASSGPGHRTLHTPNENLPLILSENRAAQESIDSVRHEHWRYTRYHDGTEELYDHAADPQEWTNLAADPTFRNVCDRLRGAIPSDR
jgi:hypothetical protein